VPLLAAENVDAQGFVARTLTKLKLFFTGNAGGG